MTDKVVIVVGSDTNIIQMFNQKSGYKAYGDHISYKPDLICFIGGADVNPQLYGEEKLAETFPNQACDDRDIRAYKDYSDLPKVGICRG